MAARTGAFEIVIDERHGRSSFIEKHLTLPRMANRKRFHALMAAFGTTGAGALLAAATLTTGSDGCGGNTSGNRLSTSSMDGAADSAWEPSMDSGADDHIPEAGAGDAGGRESGAGWPPADWSTEEANAMCQGILSCCSGGLDSGTYSVSECEAAFQSEGWFEYTLPSRADLYQSDHIAFDEDAGATCLSALRNFPCGTKTASSWQSITKPCFAALHGTIVTGGTGCRSSWECAPGNFCDSTVDGGLCTPLVGKGQPCGGKAPNNEMCSYLGSDNPALWCDVLDGGSTCQLLLANGSACTDTSMQHFYDMGCVAGLCGDDGLCGDTTATPFPSFCQRYAIRDAGGGD